MKPRTIRRGRYGQGQAGCVLRFGVGEWQVTPGACQAAGGSVFSLSSPRINSSDDAAEFGNEMLLLSRLIEDYEDQTFPVPTSAPHQTLQFLLAQNDLR